MEDTGLSCAVKTILVRKQQAEQWAKQQSRQAVLERIRRWLNGFNKLQSTLGAACKNRFMMMKQDVWYDYKTGLLLPKLDTFICPRYKLREFVRNRAKILASEGMSFSSFTGRLITREECREIFQRTVNYPYRDGGHDRLVIKSAKGSMLARALIDDEISMDMHVCATYYISAGDAHALSLDYVGVLIRKKTGKGPYLFGWKFQPIGGGAEIVPGIYFPENKGMAAGIFAGGRKGKRFQQNLPAASAVRYGGNRGTVRRGL